MNSLVNIADGKVVVSSRQVAEVFGKEHKHILRDIKVIMEETGKSNFGHTSLFFESTYTDQCNRSQTEYIMNKLGFSVLTMGFTGSSALQWKIKYAKAFEDMEDRLRNPVTLPQTYKEALVALLSSVEDNERLTATIAIQAPKVEYFDDLVHHGLSLSFRDTAKELGIPERKFIATLEAYGYVYRNSKKKLMPYAKYVGSYFEVK